jgi:hypothetical protein
MREACTVWSRGEERHLLLSACSAVRRSSAPFRSKEPTKSFPWFETEKPSG